MMPTPPVHTEAGHGSAGLAIAVLVLCRNQQASNGKLSMALQDIERLRPDSAGADNLGSSPISVQHNNVAAQSEKHLVSFGFDCWHSR